MAKSNPLNPCRCARCDEELYKPVFFKGKPYGWTCITYINPYAKKTKKKQPPLVLAKVERVEGLKVVFSCNGKKFSKKGARYVADYADEVGNEVYVDLISVEKWKQSFLAAIYDKSVYLEKHILKIKEVSPYGWAKSWSDFSLEENGKSINRLKFNKHFPNEIYQMNLSAGDEVTVYL